MLLSCSTNPPLVEQHILRLNLKMNGTVHFAKFESEPQEDSTDEVNKMKCRRKISERRSNDVKLVTFIKYK